MLKNKMKAIEIKNVSKKFGNKLILDNISMDIYFGERVAVMGANGAGKTTLVEMVGQTSEPSDGEIKINLDGDLKNQIGIQFQEGSWPKGLSAYDMLKLYKKVFVNFDAEREKELIEVFEIDEFIKKPLSKLSGGQKQRFNAMISVLNNPKIIILDELTTALDMQLQFKILDYFKNSTSKNNQTLLMVSHNPEEVELLCDRVIIVGNKKILLDLSIDEVIEKYSSVRKMMNEYFKGGSNNEFC